MMQAIARMAGRAVVGGLVWLAWLIPRAVVPRRKDWIAVLGRGDGTFVDNCKYFFIDAQADAHLRVTYVTSHDGVVTELRAAGVPVLRYPGMRAAWFLLRAGSAVVDTTEWTQRGRRALLSGSRLVQLWHGVGFKRVELDRWKRESASPLAFRIRCALYRLSGRLVRYDAVLTTSHFYERELFTKAFLSRHWLPANYPRNTFGRDAHLPDLVNVGVDAVALDRVDTWTRSGLRVVLIAPTFRDDGSHSLPMTEGERSDIEGFCRNEGIRLVFKMHPLDRSEIILAEDVAAICAAHSDAYPVLGRVSALVTDYSSIYMDFLAADRPVLFYVPDFERYVAQRETQFDIADMTPGPKSTNWNQLLNHLREQLRDDGFREERHRLRALAFDDHDPADSVASILHHLHSPRGNSA